MTRPVFRRFTRDRVGVISAFVLLGVFPIAVKKVIGKWKAGRTATADEE